MFWKLRKYQGRKQQFLPRFVMRGTGRKRQLCPGRYESRLFGRYEGGLLMTCSYDTENQFIFLTFGLVEKENRENWGWFMSWLRRELSGPGRIGVTSDQHAGIKAVF
jgi:hypothetical protein